MDSLARPHCFLSACCVQQAGLRALVVNFPHNPTGYLPPPMEFGALVEMARSRDAWLFCDEMYRDLEQSPADRLPAAVEVTAASLLSRGCPRRAHLA
jgi:aspartate/methionine/tyrosine aminotransferase